MPSLVTNIPAESSVLRKVLTETYLLPSFDETHVYIFPGTVKHLHPEFDPVLLYLLLTDPRALVRTLLVVFVYRVDVSRNAFV